MRSPSRPAVAGALLGVAVVAVVAALVWVVITRAGSGVANDEGLDDTGDPGTVGSSSSTAASRTPSPSEPTTRENPDAKPVLRTVRGTGGAVTASCTGEVARLVAATPHGGYAAEVEDSGPDRVRVDFESDDLRTRIEAVCAEGSPAFSVEEQD